MFTSNEIASITILVPYHKGREIVNQIIPFKVFKDQQQYRAVPLISTEERQLTGLPEQMSFRFNDYKVLAAADTNEGNLEAINNIVRELRMLRIV